MKDLGTKGNRFYDNPSSGMNDTVYPSAHMPHAILDKGHEVGDSVKMTVHGKIKSIEEREGAPGHVEIEMHSGDLEKMKEEEAKEKE